MNMVFKVIAFSIAINFAIGLLLNVLPIYGEMDPTLRGGIDYDDDHIKVFTDSMSKNISPTGDLEDTGDGLYRVLDFMNIGMIANFANTIKRYLYGFIQLLELIVGPYLDTPVRELLFGDPENRLNPGIFYSIMSIGYIIGVLYLWTDKNPFSGS